VKRLRKEWREVSADPNAVDQLTAQLGGFRPLAQMLASRGILTLDDIKSFREGTSQFDVDPWSMADMDRATQRLLDARERNELVWLFGDYDVDGTTAVSVGKMALEAGGWRVATYIPDRYDEGYGLSSQGIAVALKAHASVMVTLDCGIKSHDLIAQAQDQGLDVIVTDHHTPGDTLPPAIAVLDPMRSDCAFPEKGISGCGVGFMLWYAAYDRAGLDVDQLNAWHDLLAISIGADMVPLRGLNRWWAHRGLAQINQDPRPAVAALLGDKLRHGPINLQDVVFTIGPKINAAGRMRHGHWAVDLMTTPQPDLLNQLSQNITDFNTERRAEEQALVARAAKQAEAYTDAPALVLSGEGWHKGVLGIVAQRLTEQFHKPTIVLSARHGILSGSARTAGGLNLYEAIDAASEHLIQFGGHRAAAGMTLKSESLNAFRQAFTAEVDRLWPHEDRHPVQHIDALCTLEELNERMMALLDRLAPFGQGFPMPTWGLRGVTLQHVNRLSDGKHLKASITEGGVALEAIGFGWGDFQGTDAPVDVAVQLDWNHFRGQSRLQARIVDLQAHHG